MLTGRAMYIWELDISLKGGSVAALVIKAQQAKISSLWIKIGDGNAAHDNILGNNVKVMKELVTSCEAANISVLGYHVPHCATPQASEEEVTFVKTSISNFGLAGVVIDNEDGSTYFQGDNQCANAYGSGIRIAMKAANKLIVMSSNDIISAHPNSYASVIGQYIDLKASQVYYGQSPSVQSRLNRAMQENKNIAAPFFPVGAAFLSSDSDGGFSDSRTCAQWAAQFIQLVSQLHQADPNKYPGYGFWDWQEAPDEFWQVLYSTDVFVKPIAVAAALLDKGSETDAQVLPLERPQLNRQNARRLMTTVRQAGWLAALVLIAAFAGNMLFAANNLLGTWLITLVVIAVSLALLGLAAGRWEATFIDNRNRMSLSKLQVLLWTIAIFSSLLSASCFNYGVNGEISSIMGIAVDARLWGLLGISLSLAIGQPLALSGKGSRTASESELKDTKRNLQAITNVPATNIQNNGHVLTKADLADARWSDLVRGDDVGNADMIDFSKVQQLYFTLLTLLIFGLAVAGEFTDSASKNVAIKQLPVPDAGFLGLLAASGAGYLVYKGMSHSKDGS